MGVGVAGVANYTNTSSGTASNVVAYGGVGGPYEYCSFFSVLNWFAAGEQGAWYDPSDLTTLFQESTGITPMAAVGTVADQPVGLMLDKSKGLALGAELVTNGTFDTNLTGWTAQNLQAWVFGQLQVYGAAVTKLSTQQIPVVVGKTYKITATYGGGTGSAFCQFGTTYPLSSDLGVTPTVTAGTSITTSVFITATTTNINFQCCAIGAGQDAFFDNISVKQIAGNHAFQATSAKRPILSARVNLLTKTEDFSDVAWTKSGITQTYGASDPVGGNTATSLKATVADGQIYQTLSTQTLAIQTVWLRRKVGVGSVALYNGTAIIPLTITNLWAPFSLVLVVPTFYILNIVITTLGDEIDIWHPDVRPTNAGALLPPYQRVNTASDYDSVGFPLYLKCNGTSSTMSTNSIDFTSTDKMTVVTGYSISNAATYAHILNLGNALQGSAPGGFWLANADSPRLSMVYQLSNVVASYVGFSWPAADAPIPLGAGNVFSVVMDGAGATYATAMPYIKNRITNCTWQAQGTIPSPSGKFGNLPLFIGRPYTTAFNGNFYGAVIRGAQSDTASLTQAENYMATKTGITF